MSITPMICTIALVSLLWLSRSEATLTEAEKTMGLAIVDKLDSMMGYHLVYSGGSNTGGSSSHHCPPGVMCSMAVDVSVARQVFQYLDCIIVLDNSGSIGQTEFSQAKEAAKKIVQFIETKGPVKPDGSRIGLVEFSSPSQTHVVFGLTSSHLYELEVENAIGSVGYDKGGSTATERALEVTKAEFQQHNSHFNARTAWILTDGNSNEGGNPAVAAQQLKDMGVMVCAVAVGNSVNMNEINAIGSKGCAFNPSTFKKLADIIDYGTKTRAHSPSNPTISPSFFSGLVGKRFLKKLLKKRYI